MIYYICEYADYTELPDKLFCEHSPSSNERRSLDSSKFIARCEDHAPKSGCLAWMNGTELSFTHEEILTELCKAEWTTPTE